MVLAVVPGSPVPGGRQGSVVLAARPVRVALRASKDRRVRLGAGGPGRRVPWDRPASLAFRAVREVPVRRVRPAGPLCPVVRSFPVCPA